MKIWICKCGSPMDRPNGNSDYWRCAWCGTQLDGYYPDETPGCKEVKLQNFKTSLTPLSIYNGHLIEELPSTINNGTVIVVSDSPLEFRKRKYNKGYTHHFATQEVFDSMLGKKTFIHTRLFNFVKQYFKNFL